LDWERITTNFVLFNGTIAIVMFYVGRKSAVDILSIIISSPGPKG